MSLTHASGYVRETPECEHEPLPEAVHALARRIAQLELIEQAARALLASMDATGWHPTMVELDLDALRLALDDGDEDA
jgi:hypothetical protein